MKRAAVLLPVLLLAGCGSTSTLTIHVPVHALKGAVHPLSQNALGSQELDGMSFPTARTGYLVTGDGRLLRSENDGTSWRQVGKLPPADLDFLTPRVGFALTGGGQLLATLDGGRHWRLLRRFRMTNPGVPFAGTLDFVDRSHGWVVPPSGRIYRTVDGGRSWTRLGFHSCFAFGGLSFVDTQNGFVACTGQPATIESEKSLYATHDSGNTWMLVARTHWSRRGRRYPNIPSTGYADELNFRSAERGFMVADCLGIYVTRHGGRGWNTSLFTDDAYTVVATAWPSPRVAYALTGPHDDALQRSSDGGRHWRVVYQATPQIPENAIAFRSALVGVGSGPSGYEPTTGHPASVGTIVGTADGGRIWKQLSRLPGNAQQLVWRGQSLFANVHRFSGPDALYRSRDGGRTWTQLPRPRHIRLSWLDVAPDRTIFLYTDYSIFRSQDGGRSWERTGRSHGAVAFVSATHGFSVGRPRVRETTDGGRTWRTVRTPGIRPFDMYILDARHWWFSGFQDCGGLKGLCARKLLLRTSDAGAHWEAFSLPSLIESGTYLFVTPKVGYETGYGAILRTTDGGRIWRPVPPRLPAYR